MRVYCDLRNRDGNNRCNSNYEYNSGVDNRSDRNNYSSSSNNINENYNYDYYYYNYSASNSWLVVLTSGSMT